MKARTRNYELLLLLALEAHSFLSLAVVHRKVYIMSGKSQSSKPVNPDNLQVSQNNVDFERNFCNVSTEVAGVPHFSDQFKVCERKLFYNKNRQGKFLFPVHILPMHRPYAEATGKNMDGPFEHLSPWLWQLCELPQRCGARMSNICNLYYVFGSIRESLSYICCRFCLERVKEKIFGNYDDVFVNIHHIHDTYHVHCMDCGDMIKNSNCVMQCVITYKEISPLFFAQRQVDA